jgi:hypothetical protein
MLDKISCMQDKIVRIDKYNRDIAIISPNVVTDQMLDLENKMLWLEQKMLAVEKDNSHEHVKTKKFNCIIENRNQSSAIETDENEITRIIVKNDDIWEDALEYQMGVIQEVIQEVSSTENETEGLTQPNEPNIPTNIVHTIATVHQIPKENLVEESFDGSEIHTLFEENFKPTEVAPPKEILNPTNEETPEEYKCKETDLIAQPEEDTYEDTYVASPDNLIAKYYGLSNYSDVSSDEDSDEESSHDKPESSDEEEIKSPKELYWTFHDDDS